MNRLVSDPKIAYPMEASFWTGAIGGFLQALPTILSTTLTLLGIAYYGILLYQMWRDRNKTKESK